MKNLPEDKPSLFEHLPPQVINGRLKEVPAIPHAGEHKVPYNPAPTVGGDASNGLVTQNGKPVGPGTL